MPQRGTTNHRLQQWQEAVWLTIALVTPLFVNLWVEQQFEASKIWLVRTLIWTLAGLWLGGWMVGVRPKPPPSTVRNFVIALSLILLLSTILSANHSTAIFGSLDRANGVLTQLSYVLLFLCVATRIDGQSSQQLLHVIVLTAAPICLLGLAQAGGWQPLPVFTDARSPLTTTLGRANFTGAYLALLLPLTWTAAQTALLTWQRRGYAALVAMEVIVLTLAQARAAWIAAIVGMSVLLWLQAAPHWSRRVRWLGALGGSALLGGALLLILQRGIDSGGSIAARWTIWQASLRLLWPHLWLGYGADTLDLYFPSVYPPQLVYYQGRSVVVDRAHNWLLDWSLSFGIVATIVLLGLIYFALQSGWQRLTHEEISTSSSVDHQHAKRWLAACMAAICAQMIGNLFLFEVAATAVVFWLLLGIVIAQTSKRTVEAPSIALASWKTRAMTIAGALILIWAVWQSNLRPLLADMHSWRGTQALSRGDHRVALAEYRVAVQFQPQRASYHVAVALTAAESGNFAQAESAIWAAIALRPTDPVLYTQLAALYGREAIESPEKRNMAARAYERALALAPTIALTYQQYADFALRSGDGNGALLYAQRAVALDATDGIAFGIVGWVQLQNGNPAAALDAFEQAVKWAPDSADFYLGLATAHAQQGNLDAARQALQQSLTLDPTYPAALTLQVQLK